MSPKPCPPLNIPNSHLEYNEPVRADGKYGIGVQFKYSCKSGYSMTTSDDAGTCKKTGKWDNPNPGCKRSKGKCIHYFALHISWTFD